MSTKNLHIGIFGLGTVGTGVVELLMKKKDAPGNYHFILEKVVVKNPNKKREIDVPSDFLSLNPDDILNNPAIDTVIEVIGGIHPAKEFVIQALEKGKNVITANKALLASYGSEIFNKAVENRCYLGVRASNIAAYRIIESLTTSPSKIEKLIGIFNGTCNYILTEMEKKGESFSAILKRAQKMGYAEADPINDINGYDTAHKLIVLLGISLGYFPPIKSVYTEGINNITLQDVLFARELGYRIKLVAIAKREEEMLEARVHPVLIPKEKWLARLEGIENGVEVRDEIGLEIGMQAPGAGKYPTATAIMEDLICISRGRGLFFPPRKSSITLKPIEKIETKYYLKFHAVDKAGVLAKIASILGDYNISIESVIQKGKGDKRKENEMVPVIMLTHRSREDNIQKALKKINDLPEVEKNPLLIRVEEGIF